jgi:hypothetical protein
MEYLYVKKYHKYQHYSDRSIKWVKLYIDTLTDFKIIQLTPLERWIFIGLILVGSRNKNKISYDISYLKVVLSIPDPLEKELEPAIKRLLNFKLLASKTLAKC